MYSTKHYPENEILSNKNPTKTLIQWNRSNPTHQGTREMCRIVQDVGILGFVSVNRNTLGSYIFVGCHRMLENSGVGLNRFHCNSILIYQDIVKMGGKYI